jgi:hypothetical protein
MQTLEEISKQNDRTRKPGTRRYILKPLVLVKKYVHHTYLERLTISQLKDCGTACFKAFREYKISKTYESEEGLKGNYRLNDCR